MYSPPHQQEQDSHTYRQAVGDLLRDDALRTVRDVGRDFDAAINWARSHDQNVILRALHTFVGSWRTAERIRERTGTVVCTAVRIECVSRFKHVALGKYVVQAMSYPDS